MKLLKAFNIAINQENMRVLIITSHEILKDESGTPKHIRKVVIELSSRNIDVCVVYLTFKSKCSSKISCKEQANVLMYKLPLLEWIYGSKKIIEAFRPDVFLAFTSGAACRFLPLLWMYKIPLLYEVHAPFSPFSIKSLVPSFYSLLERLVCKRANHLVVLGEKVKGLYSEERCIPTRKISIIYPSIKIENFSAISNPSMASKRISGQINVTYLGNLIYENHGIDYLLKSASLVLDRNSKVNFNLIGKPDSAEEKYRHIPFDRDRVKFSYTDNIDEIDLLLADSDILVHTRVQSLHNLSVQSKFGVYMACGKPVVVTDFADYKTFINQYQCGYAVKLVPEEIADAILDLAKNRALRLEMGRNSLQVAKTHFNLSKSIDRYVEILETIAI